MKSVKKAFIAVCSIYLVIGLNICYAQSRHSKLTKSNTDNKYRHDRFVASLLKKTG